MIQPLRRAHFRIWVVLALLLYAVAGRLIGTSNHNSDQSNTSLGAASMSLGYQAIGWNRTKKIYDTALALGLVLYLVVFLGIGSFVHPNATAETLLIRALGTAALLLLHVIMCIGPLCRLDRRFLPLLYNRRHLGVTMSSWRRRTGRSPFSSSTLWEI